MDIRQTQPVMHTPIVIEQDPFTALYILRSENRPERVTYYVCCTLSCEEGTQECRGYSV